MRHYAAINSYGTPFSVGFTNTWTVLAFDSRKTRDAFVAGRDDLATRAIKKREVTKYAKNWNMNRNDYDQPAPFTGEYWGIIDDHPEWTAADRPDGYLGYVGICDPYDRCNENRVF